MLSDELLAILICPENRTRLSPADRGLIDRINARIAQGRLLNASGQPISQPIQGGLVREDGKVLYPIVDDIPNLLVDRAVPLEQLDAASGATGDGM